MFQNRDALQLAAVMRVNYLQHSSQHLEQSLAFHCPILLPCQELLHVPVTSKTTPSFLLLSALYLFPFLLQSEPPPRTLHPLLCLSVFAIHHFSALVQALSQTEGVFIWMKQFISLFWEITYYNCTFSLAGLMTIPKHLALVTNVNENYKQLEEK